MLELLGSRAIRLTPRGEPKLESNVNVAVPDTTEVEIGFSSVKVEPPLVDFQMPTPGVSG